MQTTQDSLQGLVKSYNGLHLYLLNKIVLRLHSQKNKVQLISGGGSGHEPHSPGFVGQGMLSAAVCGEIFSSPTVNDILSAILLCGDRNTSFLLIVKNYTGDRLNFGLATEIAKSRYGYENIKILLIDDDCSIAHENVQHSVGKRGIAGTVLIHKIAGAMAELDYSLDEIYALCDNLLKSRRLRTIGITFKSFGNDLTNVEIGKGIHGEPGIEKFEKCRNFSEINKIFLEKLSYKLPLKSNVVLLINNIGGTSLHTFNAFISILLEEINQLFNVVKLLQGPFLTSLNTEGLSVTILTVQNDAELITKFLELETRVASNVFNCNGINTEKQSIINNESFKLPITVINKSLGKKFINNQSFQIDKTLRNICSDLMDAAETLNTMDKEYGDGDTGNTFTVASKAILESLDHLKDTQHPSELLQQLSDIMQNKMGGSSGALYSIFLQVASQAFGNHSENDTTINIEDWINGLSSGITAVMSYSLANIGDRTMIDPLKAAEINLRNSLNKNLDIKSYLKIFYETCEKGASDTINMIPKSGRAAYSFSEGKKNFSSSTYPDPGAFAVSIWSKSLYNSFD